MDQNLQFLLLFMQRQRTQVNGKTLDDVNTVHVDATMNGAQNRRDGAATSRLLLNGLLSIRTLSEMKGSVTCVDGFCAGDIYDMICILMEMEFGLHSFHILQSCLRCSTYKL